MSGTGDALGWGGSQRERGKRKEAKGSVPRASAGGMLAKIAADSDLNQWSSDVYLAGRLSTHKIVKTTPPHTHTQRLCYVDRIYLYLTIFKILKVKFID